MTLPNVLRDLLMKVASFSTENVRWEEAAAAPRFFEPAGLRSRLDTGLFDCTGDGCPLSSVSCALRSEPAKSTMLSMLVLNDLAWFITYRRTWKT